MALTTCPGNKFKHPCILDLPMLKTQKVVVKATISCFTQTEQNGIVKMIASLKMKLLTNKDKRNSSMRQQPGLSVMKEPHTMSITATSHTSAQPKGNWSPNLYLKMQN
ncbi:hypothetical protein PAXRUDRAFT_180556 [Paxillus rubicundulus Ve08.2h10]|uniref:Uncharacterized protein n=1 Tax=Paxillus rubicundulus Ve08.2h10 TaxID=930991 RepID=A0A0D0CAB9_9AGAM|nr:hypothetical protein PAXRUDRAFT_180556 [Paxillus rubicundulus Ve08.2h10]